MDLTSFLLGLGTAGVSWLAGLAASAFLQDREYYRRQRGTVAVLATEVSRILDELGGGNAQWIDVAVLGQQAAIPEVHSWAHTSVAEVAQSDPSVLERFMRLDRFLNNQKLFVNVMRQSREEFSIAQKELQESKTEGTATTDPAVAAEELMARLSAKLEAEKRKEAVRDAVSFVDMNNRRIIDTLKSLRDSLAELDKVLRTQPAVSVRRLLGIRVLLLKDESKRAKT